MPSIARSFLAIVFTVTVPAFAQDDLEKQIAELTQTADQAEQARQAGEPAVTAAREQSRKLAQDHTDLRLELSRSEGVVKEMEPKLAGLQEAAKKAADAKTPLETAAAEAVKAAEAAKDTDGFEAADKASKEAAEKLAAAAKAADEAAAALKAVEEPLAAAKMVVATYPDKIKAAEEAMKAFEPELAKAEEAYALLVNESVARRVALEDVLFANGRMVSFRRQVAPILQARCVACHNARTAKGRFNCETFANMMKGGESGESIVATAADSLLHIMVVDGSMPKDSDPLLKEEQDLIAKWIDSGAKLDAGVSSAAALITIIPKPVQPSPPESYRVPVPVTALAFSPDGQLLATSGYREVLLWKVEDGSLVRRISNLAERPHDIEFSKDGQVLAVAAGTPGQLGEVKLFSVADGSVVADLFTTDDEAFSVAYSPDGAKIATTSADRALRVFEVSTGKRLLQIEDHADWVLDVAWSPDGKWLATASRDKTAKVFNAETGDSQVTFNSHGEPVFGVFFLSDSKQVATSGRDNRIRVWNSEDAKQVREIRGFGGEVFRIVRTPDDLVASGCSDKIARLQKLADGAEVKKFVGHNDWVYSVAVHPDTKRIATGCHDGEVRVWNMEDGAMVRNFFAAPGYSAPVAAANP